VERLGEFLPFTYVLPKAAMAEVIPASSFSNRFSSLFSKRKTASKTDIEFSLTLDSINIEGFSVLTRLPVLGLSLQASAFKEPCMVNRGVLENCAR